jgi:hypothetical protein
MQHASINLVVKELHEGMGISMAEDWQLRNPGPGKTPHRCSDRYSGYALRRSHSGPQAITFPRFPIWGTSYQGTFTSRLLFRTKTPTPPHHKIWKRASACMNNTTTGRRSEQSMGLGRTVCALLSSSSPARSTGSPTRRCKRTGLSANLRWSLVQHLTSYIRTWDYFPLCCAQVLRWRWNPILAALE